MATLISVGLKVLYPMVRMVVRGRIDPHRPAALHLTGLFFLVFSILGFSIFFLLFAFSLTFFPHYIFISFLVQFSLLFSSALGTYLWIERKQPKPKLRGLCVNSEAQQSREQSGTGQSRVKQPVRAEKQSTTWCNMRLCKLSSILILYNKIYTNPW